MQQIQCPFLILFPPIYKFHLIKQQKLQQHNNQSIPVDETLILSEINNNTKASKNVSKWFNNPFSASAKNQLTHKYKQFLSELLFNRLNVIDKKVTPLTIVILFYRIDRMFSVDPKLLDALTSSKFTNLGFIVINRQKIAQKVKVISDKVRTMTFLDDVYRSSNIIDGKECYQVDKDGYIEKTGVTLDQFYAVDFSILSYIYLSDDTHYTGLPESLIYLRTRIKTEVVETFNVVTRVKSISTMGKLCISFYDHGFLRKMRTDNYSICMFEDNCCEKFDFNSVRTLQALYYYANWMTFLQKKLSYRVESNIKVEYIREVVNIVSRNMREYVGYLEWSKSLMQPGAYVVLIVPKGIGKTSILNILRTREKFKRTFICDSDMHDKFLSYMVTLHGIAILNADGLDINNHQILDAVSYIYESGAGIIPFFETLLCDLLARNKEYSQLLHEQYDDLVKNRLFNKLLTEFTDIFYSVCNNKIVGMKKFTMMLIEYAFKIGYDNVIMCFHTADHAWLGIPQTGMLELTVDYNNLLILDNANRIDHITYIQSLLEIIYTRMRVSGPRIKVSSLLEYGH